MPPRCCRRLTMDAQGTPMIQADAINFEYASSNFLFWFVSAPHIEFSLVYPIRLALLDNIFLLLGPVKYPDCTHHHCVGRWPGCVLKTASEGFTAEPVAGWILWGPWPSLPPLFSLSTSAVAFSSSSGINTEIGMGKARRGKQRPSSLERWRLWPSCSTKLQIA